ncbi:MAG: M3 family oligoendopeptidase [Clostridia bacterium]|nr:M3 family oligoendopeptidase [Clostridia bacterium]
MDYTWDLSPLYEGFDTDAFRADLAALDAVMESVNAFAAEPAAAELAANDANAFLHRYIDLYEQANTLAAKLICYTQLRSAANTADMEAASMMGNLMMKLSATAAADTVLRQRVAAIEDLEAVIDADEGLHEYRFALDSIKRENRYLLSDREEALFARLNISGASAWSDMRDYLTSSLKVDYRGKQITFSEVRNLAYDSDPAVRKDAYDAEIACYEKVKDAVAFSLNSIKQQVLTECDIRGYESPLDKALKASRMKRETLDALLGAMVDYMPAFRKYLRAKAKALGHEGGLPWWDLFAPMGGMDKKFTVEEAKDYLLAIFAGFDSEMHDMVKASFEERRIDFFPREGKVGGAFDMGIAPIGQSRVLTNFDGAFGDVVTLAHELGHSFHDKMVFSHSPLTQDYTMPVAETASTFNETLVTGTAIARATDKNEKLALLESRLQDAAQIFCDIYSRYLFEASVFEHRKEEFLDADRLCGLMLDAQREAYGDGLDEVTLHPYMWVCKGHYYSGGLSFYNFPYAFGGLFARGLYAKYEEMGAEFVPMYKKLLNATSVCTVEDAAAIAGIDLTDRAFWEAGLAAFAADVEQFCALIET